MTDIPEINNNTLSEAEKLAGLTFTESERELMLKGVIERRDDYAKLREVPLENNIPPALQFIPQSPISSSPASRSAITLDHVPVPQRPSPLEEVAFWPVTQLAQLLRTRQVTSVDRDVPGPVEAVRSAAKMCHHPDGGASVSPG